MAVQFASVHAFSMDDCGAIPGMLAATDEWRRQAARINELFGNSE
jgi:hypothetical protein